MKNKYIILIALTGLLSCNEAVDINDELKRNENWSWVIDRSTGLGEWTSTGNSEPSDSKDYTLFHNNGTVSMKKYKVNEQNWLVTYNENGQTLDSVYTIDDKKSGVARYYYPSGNLESVQTFKNDSLTGYYCSYHENGQIRQEGKRWQELADDTLKDWYENGQLKAQRYYEKGLKQGSYTHWFKSGKIQVKGSFVNDKKDGMYQEFYENEKLKKTGKHSNGEKIGIWEYYDENGNLIDTKTY